MFLTFSPDGWFQMDCNSAVGIVNLANEELGRKLLYREILKEKTMRGEVPEEQKEKKLTFKKPFTRALTGKLLNGIENNSGAVVDVIRSPGERETVMLRGTSKSVDKVEGMLEELLSSALEIFISGEERDALLTGGRRCIMNKIQQKLQVPLSFQGQTILQTITWCCKICV